jgi:hypothetical protein
VSAIALTGSESVFTFPWGRKTRLLVCSNLDCGRVTEPDESPAGNRQTPRDLSTVGVRFTTSSDRRSSGGQAPLNALKAR